MRFIFLIVFGFIVCHNATAQNYSSISSIKKKVDSVRTSIFPYPSSDLLPLEFTSPTLEKEYYGVSDPKTVPTFYRGHVFVLTLRNNCTFVYETFYQPYSCARIEFFIGKYRVAGDTIHLTYNSLLPGKPGEDYVSPTITVSWRLPPKPNYLLIDKTMLLEPFEQRLKKATSYTLSDKSQFDFRGCKE